MPRRGRPDPNKKSSLPTIPPDAKCNGIVRSGLAYCTQVAGRGTDHPGQGRCKLHGGANPMKHGRYSTLKTEALRDLIAQFEADPEPLSMFPELAACRALFQDYIDRYQAYTAALIAWHDSYLDPNRATEPKPRQVLDVADAYRLLAEATTIVARIEKVASDNAISRPDFLRLQGEQGEVVARALDRHLKGHVHEAVVAAIHDEIRDGWLALRTR